MFSLLYPDDGSTTEGGSVRRTSGLLAADRGGLAKVHMVECLNTYSEQHTPLYEIETEGVIEFYKRKPRKRNLVESQNSKTYQIEVEREGSILLLTTEQAIEHVPNTHTATHIVPHFLFDFIVFMSICESRRRTNDISTY